MENIFLLIDFTSQYEFRVISAFASRLRKLSRSVFVSATIATLLLNASMKGLSKKDEIKYLLQHVWKLKEKTFPNLFVISIDPSVPVNSPE